MLDPTIILLIVVVFLALSFDFINGFHDTANAIATSILTRALSVRNAIFLSAAQNFIGAMIWTGVAKTIGKGIVDPKLVDGVSGQALVLAALIAAIFWNLFTWWKGLPSSSSHALIGGIAGAGIAAGGGFSVLNFSGIYKIFIALVTSPIAGLLVGAIFMKVVMNIFANQAPSKLNRYFKIFQVISANFMAFSHGSNDAQKSMGIIALALVVTGQMDALNIPLWVKISCAGAMALGTAMGGWRIIKTVGKKVASLQPVHGFVSETSAALVVIAATHFGAPVSTTHVVSSSIVGTNTSRGLSKVRWGIVGQIGLAWLMTLPVCITLGAGCYYLIRLLF